MIYKITVDISKVLPELKKRKIVVYKEKLAFIYLEAINPDDACKKAIEEICQNIYRQKRTASSKKFVLSVKELISVKKIERIRPNG
jgi:nitrogen regulatory protein PII|tara:strand:+ start:189 stop:446 length:258 start_codon:yes stop_codon:yes gene_type:complete